MKKMYNFMAVLMAVVLFFGMNTTAYSQVVLSENFDLLANEGGTQGGGASGTSITATLNDYTQTPGWSGDWIYPAYGKIKLGKSTSGLGFIQLPTLDLSANNGNFVIHFKSMAWLNDSTSIKIYVNDVPTIVSGLSNTDAYIMNDYDVFFSGGTAATTIKFEGMGANKARFFLDSIIVEHNSAPVLSCNANINFGNVRQNDSVIYNLAVSGHNLTAGNNTTVTIAGTGFSTTTTTLTNDALMAAGGVVVPVAFFSADTGVFTGTLTFSNSDLTTDKVINLSAHCVGFTEISTLAELRTMYDYSNISGNTTDNVIYKYTGEAIVTAVVAYKNQKCIQDATGAIFIFDQDGAITTPLAVGDKITGVYGKLSNYYGYLEFKPQFNIDRKINSYNDVTPLEITLEQLQDQAYMGQHQAELVSISNATFTTTGTFDFGLRYAVAQENTTDTAVATLFSDADYVAQNSPIPTTSMNIVGINYFTSRINSVNYPARYYVVPRALYDFVGIAENNFNLNAVKVYPNPTTDNVVIALDENTTATHVDIYDVFGKLANSQSLNNDNVVSMSNLTTGVYFLRIFNDNAIVGTAKIIKK